MILNEISSNVFQKNSKETSSSCSSSSSSSSSSSLTLKTSFSTLRTSNSLTSSSFPHSPSSSHNSPSSSSSSNFYNSNSSSLSSPHSFPSLSISTSSNICHVGYALNPKKLRKSDKGKNINSNKKIWMGGGLSDILTDEIEDNVLFKSFDFELDIEQQPHYHVIIHKITEDIRSDDNESLHKVQVLEKYLKLHPNTIIVDPIDCVRNVITRSRVCNVLNDIIQNICKTSMNSCPFKQPKYLIVEHTEKIYEKFQQSKLRFPVICKPIEACGTPNSHSMVVALSYEGLSLVHCPCVIQEYWDHSATFYKVYVIDEDVMVYRRPSLPDIQHMSENHTLRSIIFDSRYAYPTIEDFLIPTDIQQQIDNEHEQHMDQSEYSPLLNLFNHHNNNNSNNNHNNHHNHSNHHHNHHHSNNNLHLIPLPLSLPLFQEFDIHSISSSSTPIPSLSSSSYSSTTSSCTDMEFNYTFDENYQLPSTSLGSYYHTTPQRGLKPGASPQKTSFLESVINFDSNQTSQNEKSDILTSIKPCSEQETKHQERFQEIANHLKNGFGLSLFGFDVLIPTQLNHNSNSTSQQNITENEEFFIIDVNFFPSYKEVHDFPSRLRKMLRKKANL